MPANVCQKPTSSWSIYIVETRLNHWYTGITTDVDRRFEQHKTGKGAKALAGKGPLKLIMSQVVGTRSEASRLEYQVKQLSKLEKVKWANACLSANSLRPIGK